MTIDMRLIERRRRLLLRRKLLDFCPDLDEGLVKASLWGAKDLGSALGNLLRLTGQEAAVMRELRACMADWLEERGGDDYMKMARSLRDVDRVRRRDRAEQRDPLSLYLVCSTPQPKRTEHAAKPPLKAVDLASDQTLSNQNLRQPLD